MPTLQPTPDAIARAARIMRAGGIVVMPTETVYGLAADATSPAAIARVFAAKGRPQFNPLIVHVLDEAEAAHHAHLNEAARALIAKFWPGPLTIVAPFREGSPVCDLARAGLDTIALRAPSHPVARALIEAAGVPLAAPSANRSGHVSPTLAAHTEELGDAVDLILDGGPCAWGLESTIVAFGADGRKRLLRLGAIPAEQIEAEIGPLKCVTLGDAIQAPGMLARHYAPRARLRLNAEQTGANEIFVAFGPGKHTLSASANLIEAAANLYATLRALDATGAVAIAIAPIPDTGLGAAINDRLRRAAEGR
ncbi:MAG: L-threonylcarbamoyladenylate synthase [Pseudomonadota bacterium]